MPKTKNVKYKPEFTEKQGTLMWEMGHGWSLESYRVINEGITFVLCRNGQSKFADKRTINPLIKRKLIVVFKHEGYAATGRTYWSVSREKS